MSFMKHLLNGFRDIDISGSRYKPDVITAVVGNSWERVGTYFSNSYHKVLIHPEYKKRGTIAHQDGKTK